MKNEVMEKVVGYAMAAFGLVAALAWNDAIKALIEYIFPVDRNGLILKFAYALAITIVVTIVSIYLLRLTRKEGGK